MRYIHIIMALIVAIILKSCSISGTTKQGFIDFIGHDQLIRFGFTEAEIENYKNGGVLIFTSAYNLILPSLMMSYVCSVNTTVKQHDLVRMTALLHTMCLFNHETRDISAELIPILATHTDQPGVPLNQSLDYGINGFAEVLVSAITHFNDEAFAARGDIPNNYAQFSVSDINAMNELLSYVNILGDVTSASAVTTTDTQGVV